MTDVARDRPFQEPWQAQVFALTVTLLDDGVFTPAEWADALGARIAASDLPDGSDYYECWAAALGDRLAAQEIVAPHDLEFTTRAWQAAAARTPHGRPILLDD